MTSKEKQIDVLSPKGDVLIRLKIRESESVPTTAPNNGNGKSATTKDNKSLPPQNGEMMTEAQKKYLFRICGSQGMGGEEAHAHLKELFGVDALRDVSKLEASRMIEQLLAESKGGNGDGPPF
jgi:hypothetical protein